MTIKSDKVTLQVIFVSFFICLIIGMVFLADGMPMKLIFLCYSFFFYIHIAMMVSWGKTIIINEAGCTLRFWKYAKTYAWNEFTVKRIEDRRGPYDTQVHYWASVIFSIRNLHKPKIMFPDTYNLLFHPFSFSFFYVYYHVENIKSGGIIYPDIYPVDEQEFLKKMQQWGVKLEVYNAREERFK